MSLKRLQIIILFLLNINFADAKPIINNSVLPVKYFVERTHEVAQIKKVFFSEKQKILTVAGVGGVGKTQIIRKFIEENKDYYDVIWEIDCSHSITRQLKRLQEQLEDHLGINVSVNSQEDIRDLWNFLHTKRLKYLVIFDNIQVLKDNFVNNILSKEVNGNVIISTQDQGNLKSFLKIGMLSKNDSITLIDNLNKNKDLDFSGVYRKTSGHPLSIVKYIRFSNANRYMTNQEIDKWFFDDNIADYIARSLNHITKNLSDAEFKALIKITLFNNKNISKMNFIILCSKDNSIKDLYSLIQYGLIEEKQGYDNSIIGFEMHDILKQQLQKIASDKIIKENIEEALDTVNNLFYVESKTLAQILSEQPNLLEQLEKLSINAKTFNVPMSKQLEFNSNLMEVYLYYSDHEGADAQYKWFNDYIKNINVRLVKDNRELNSIAHFYLLLGIHDDFYHGDNKNACIHFNKSIAILEQMRKPDINLEYASRTQLAQSLLYGGDLSASEKEIKKIADFIERQDKQTSNKRIKIFYSIDEDEGIDTTIFYFLKAKFFLEEGEYSLALDNINRALNIKSNVSNAHIIAPAYSLKGEILERMGNAKEGIKFAQDAYNKVSNNLQKDSELLARSLICLARCEKSLDRFSDAKLHAEKAKEILKRTNKKFDESRHDDLADVISIEGEILYLEGKKEQSIELLKLSDLIYMNRFSSNIHWNKLEKLYELIIRVADDLKDSFLVKMYSKKLEAVKI